MPFGGIGADKLISMKANLIKIQNDVYKACGLNITEFEVELESIEYDACKFKLNDKEIVCRTSKITPRKIGQFVTFWKRSENGPIEPFEETDNLDFFIVIVQTKTDVGQFVFPKSILISKGVISTSTKSGKRAFRVYPPWDVPTSKQAIQSQQWQLQFFYSVNSATDLRQFEALYQAK